VGTLGHQLSPIHPAVLPIKAGDTLIFSTDGVREDFDQDLNLKQSPQQLADDIMARSARHTDDALILVGRYLG
jgi:serine phosphatase RsbU (regulator of sigma subunit)